MAQPLEGSESRVASDSATQAALVQLKRQVVILLWMGAVLGILAIGFAIYVLVAGRSREGLCAAYGREMSAPGMAVPDSLAYREWLRQRCVQELHNAAR